jgi:glucosamine 6-phosphate synthetase-like amidotransferase/phosphosugar isomerase protein
MIVCGIFASTNRDDLKALSTINAYRGQHSYSIAGFTIDDDGDPCLHSINRSLGVFDFFQVPVDSELYVCHIQAPTGETRGIESVHPASHNESLLWHNGIIKEYDCARLRTKQKSTEMWDTKLLLKEAMDPFNFSANLSEVNGSFACILYEPINGMFVFRNALSPLFIGKRWISSVKCDLANNPIQEESFYRLTITPERTFELIKIDSFKTFEHPYYWTDD